MGFEDLEPEQVQTAVEATPNSLATIVSQKTSQEKRGLTQQCRLWVWQNSWSGRRGKGNGKTRIRAVRRRPHRKKESWGREGLLCIYRLIGLKRKQGIVGGVRYLKAAGSWGRSRIWVRCETSSLPSNIKRILRSKLAFHSINNLDVE